MQKNWCLQTVVLETAPESPLESKEIKSVNFKGDQPWIISGSTDAEAETPVFWSPDANRQLIGKALDAEKDWGQKKRKRASEVEMPGWHHWCSEHELGQTAGDGEEQGGLACCSPWCHKESDMAGWLKNNNNVIFRYLTHCFLLWCVCVCVNDSTCLCFIFLNFWSTTDNHV